MLFAGAHELTGVAWMDAARFVLACLVVLLSLLWSAYNAALLAVQSALLHAVRLIHRFVQTHWWIGDAASKAASTLIVILVGYWVFDWAWRRRYLRQHPHSTAQSLPASSTAGTRQTSPTTVKKQQQQDGEEETKEGRVRRLFEHVKVLSFLEDGAASLLASLAEEETVGEAGADIGSKMIGNNGGGLCIVQRGAVSVYHEGDVLLGQVGPGGVLSSLFALLSILASSPPSLDSCMLHSSRSTTYAVDETVTLVRFPEAAFREMKSRYPVSTTHLLQLIVARFYRVSLMMLAKYIGKRHVDIAAVEASLNGSMQVSDNSIGLLLEQERKICGGDDGWFEAIPQERLREMQAMAFAQIARRLSMNTTRPAPSQATTLLDRLIEDGEAVRLVRIKRGAELMRQGDRLQGMYYLLSGRLHSAELGEVQEGSLFGLMLLFTGHARARYSYRVTDAADCIVAVLSPANADLLVDRYPEALETVVNECILPRISRLLWAVDVVVDWRHVYAGHAVVTRQHAAAPAVIVVLHGRLRQPDGTEWVAGSAIGELDFLAHTTTTNGNSDGSVGGNSGQASVVAVRDTDLAIIPGVLMAALLGRLFPERAFGVARTMARELLSSRHDKCQDHHDQSLASSLATGNLDGRPPHYRTVAIMPVSQRYTGLAAQVADVLVEATAKLGTCCLLDSRTILHILGRQAFTAIGRMRLAEWLAEQEEVFRVVFYRCDGNRSPWTQQCIRQADLLLFVAPAVDSKSGAAVDEEQVPLGEWLDDALNVNAPCELVLVHRRRGKGHSTAAAAMGSSKQAYARIHHVQLNARPSPLRKDPFSRANFFNPLQAASGTKEGVVSALEEEPGNVGFNPSAVLGETLLDWLDHLRSMHILPPTQWSQQQRRDDRSDRCFARLARHLLGRSIGLVLGGGGARGIAHVGVLRALLEADIPIDVIGGTSIGSFVGALAAVHVDDYWSILRHARAFAAQSCNYLRIALDLTYPFTSMLTGHSLNRSVWTVFGDVDIADLWLPYFCITTDIVQSCMVVHRRGPVWRYSRASMSLAGYFPPLCEREPYALLLDGGYMNNLPADVMQHEFPDCSTIIAVDVANELDLTCRTYGDAVSGWWIVARRIFYWPINRIARLFDAYGGRREEYGLWWQAPSSADIQSRLCFATNFGRAEKVQAMEGVHYLRPPVDDIGTLEFGRFDAVLERGYAYGKAVIERWKVDGTLEKMLGSQGAELAKNSIGDLKGHKRAVSL